VPGFPQGGELFALRDGIAEAIPTLKTHVPQYAHVKLGHVLIPVGVTEISELQNVMEQSEKRIDSTIVFDDVYTPLGRIKL
jgi:hypothetical protein